MKNEKYTIADVAQKAGVSRSTVSRVLNNKPGVGPALREKVLAFIKEIDYRPSTLAQGLINGRINIIGVVFGDVRNPFYADLQFHIQKILNENGYMVMSFNSEYDSAKEKEFIELACGFNFAGLILLTAQSEEMENLLPEIQIPTVLVNRTFSSYKGDTVFLDNFQAGYMVTKHLIELGHPSIAFISGHMSSSASLQRYQGYLQALKVYQLPFEEATQLFIGDLKLETGYHIAEEYLERLNSLPSAVVVSNDYMAIGFIDCCRERGVPIPGRISVASFDNISVATLRGIGLTTIDQHCQEMSLQAARLILRRIQHPDAAPERVILEPELVIRGTTGVYDPAAWKTGQA